ncbi:putative porin [Polynucleobacter sphagniphilus]|uniref:porin n=1 Tax=Polynucleobacter sphagniphilus TaxID=1743169 RepID=UPI002476A84B|nr:porin [Polynucleobacter sphagniphilus]MDH6153841.1 putative porin [Polynucleobacter sphagniphilus]
MKKSLLAVAAIGAFASAAQAQSSVTVYGILDVGYIGGNTSVQDSSKGNTAGYNQGTAKSTVSQFGQSAEQTSRLGFKGSEDLGNGKSAFFTAEFQLYPQDQTLSGNTNSTNTNGGLLNRQTFVGLKDNKIGQVAVGLQYTPVFNAAAATDVGQLNNMAGNVIYASSSGITSGQAGTNSLGFTNRTANTLSFQTAKFSGFQASGIYTLNNKNQTETGVGSSSTTGGNTNASGWGLGADYTYNKFYITAAYQALKQLTTSNDLTAIWVNQQASGATAAPVAASAATAAAQITGTASNVQDNQLYAAATYDFGILKAYAQYVTRKATDTDNTNYYGKRAAEQIGVRGYITPTIEGWASAGLGRYTTFGTTQPTANFSGWQLGSNYWLSKRTNLYAIYGSTVTSTAATAAGTTVGGSMNNYAVGVRHTF